MNPKYEALITLLGSRYKKRGRFFWGKYVVFGFLPHKDPDGVLLNLIELDRNQCGKGLGTMYLNELKDTIVSCGFKRMYVYPCPLDKGTKLKTLEHFYMKNNFYRMYEGDTFMVWWKGFLKEWR